MSVSGPELAVCSWSLRPESPEQLAREVTACGLRHIQLALDPIRDGRWDRDTTVKVLADAGISIVSGMMEMAGEDYTTLETIKETGGVRPDATWSGNLEAARANARLAVDLGLDMVTFHAGFLSTEDDAETHRMLDRLAEIVTIFEEAGISIAFETGQEAAVDLAEHLEALKARGVEVGVNFDPANMLLYGMGDPVEAIATLGPHVRQVHIKDADPAETAGTWGTEVPAGTGSVPWAEFLHAVSRHAPGVRLVIEREAGESRVEDVRGAAAMIGELRGAGASA